jgi:hypothetical protein
MKRHSMNRLTPSVPARQRHGHTNTHDGLVPAPIPSTRQGTVFDRLLHAVTARKRKIQVSDRIWLLSAMPSIQ